jgi:hypothetical protein
LLLKIVIVPFGIALGYALMVGLIDNELIAWEELHHF